MKAHVEVDNIIVAPFEQGPIRPPSEASSLLLRLTRNCPWNRCTFCNSYKNSRFSMRSTEEICRDIDAMRAIADRLNDFSMKAGGGGLLPNTLFRKTGESAFFRNTYDRSIALWLHNGGESAFFQDADSLIMKTNDVITVLLHLRQAFPTICNITTYCRSHTAARKSPAELQALREAGLTKIHIGLESGSDVVLNMIDKGTTSAEHIVAGRRIVEAGISLSEYIIPGLGGADHSMEHARETARVINEINPDYVRLRTMHVSKGTPLMESMRQGTFTPLGDEAILNEIRSFLLMLSCNRTTIVSDHILNLLEEVQGRIADDKQKMIAMIDRYFDLPYEKRLVFRMGRRRGVYRSLDDLSEEDLFHRLSEIVAQLEKQAKGSADRQIDSLLNAIV